MSADQPGGREERGDGILNAKSPDPATARRGIFIAPCVWLIMASTISKSILICVISATALVGRAHAQSGPGLAATDFTIFFERYNGSQWVQMTSVEQQYFFNRARCQCDQDLYGEFKIVIQPAVGAAAKIQALLQGNVTGGPGVGRVFAGAAGVDCLAPGNSYSLGSYCTNLLDPGNYPGVAFGMAVFGTASYWESPPIPVAYLFNSLVAPSCGSQGTCDSTSACRTTVAQTIQFWAQTNSGLLPDMDPGPSATVGLVGQVPLVPTNVAVDGGDEALSVSWSWPAGITVAADTSLLGLQLFCQRGADNQVFQSGSFGPAYQTPSTLCPTHSATEPTANGPFSNLDPRYLCSGLIPATTTSYRIAGLQNGIPYGVGVAVVDRYGNIGAISDIAYALPNAGTGGAGGTLDANGAGGSPADGGTGSSDAGSPAMLAGGCSIDVCRKHDRSETAAIACLAVATLVFARRRTIAIRLSKMR